MSRRYVTRIAASCLAALTASSLALPTSAPATLSRSTSNRSATSRTNFTAAVVSSEFAAVGLALRRIIVSPRRPHEIVLYYVNYKAFSLTIFVEANTTQARQIFNSLSPGWKHDGWPSQLARNIIVAIQPVGMRPGHAARMRPMPTAVLTALTTLSRR